MSISDELKLSNEAMGRMTSVIATERPNKYDQIQR